MTEFIIKRTANAKNDILSGLTVALALVPEAVAFAFVAGVDPLVGLYAAFMIGLITSIFGGRPGMISGATGALAVVMVSLVAEGNAMGEPGENTGLYYLFATVILMGIIQMLAGIFKLGKFVRLIPHPVMMGFVNGLAIVIFLSQLGMFKEFINGERVWMSGLELWTMLGLVGLTMGIMFGLPKITKKLPEALIAIIVVSGIVIFGNLEVATVGSFIREVGGEGLKGGLPTFQVDIYSNDYLEVKSIADTIRLTIDGYRGTVETVRIGGVSLVNERDFVEENIDPKLYRYSVDYLITYEEAI